MFLLKCLYSNRYIIILSFILHVIYLLLVLTFHLIGTRLDINKLESLRENTRSKATLYLHGKGLSLYKKKVGPVSGTCRACVLVNSFNQCVVRAGSHPLVGIVYRRHRGRCLLTGTCAHRMLLGVGAGYRWGKIGTHALVAGPSQARPLPSVLRGFPGRHWGISKGSWGKVGK